MNTVNLYIAIHTLLFIVWAASPAPTMPVWTLTIAALGIWTTCELLIGTLALRRSNLKMLIDLSIFGQRFVFATAPGGASWRANAS